jgi:hypothetical protein
MDRWGAAVLNEECGQVMRLLNIRQLGTPEGGDQE